MRSTSGGCRRTACEWTRSGASVELVKQPRASRVRKHTSAARAPRRSPVGSARKLLRIDGRVARLRLRPDRSFGAKMLYSCAVVMGVGTALLALKGNDKLWWCELFALMFLVAGFVFGLTDRETRLHFGRKLVFQRKSDAV